MYVKIKETKVMATLRLIDERTGVDYASDFIESTSGIDQWLLDIDGFPVVSQQEYEHWSTLFLENNRALMALREHQSRVVDCAYEEIYHTETRGFEHFREVCLDNFDRITAGKVSCKVVGAMSESGLQIRKAINIEMVANNSASPNLVIHGVFHLTTAYNKYEIEIEATANYGVIDDCVWVEVIEIPYCPICLSEDQEAVVVGILAEEARKQVKENQVFMDNLLCNSIAE